MICTCPIAGYCATHGRQMSSHLHKICRGEVLTPEKCEAYRANWRANPLPIAADDMVVIVPREPCRHLGEELRRQQCESCGGKVMLKIFACELRGECTTQNPLPGVACCGGCGQYEAIRRASPKKR